MSYDELPVQTRVELFKVRGPGGGGGAYTSYQGSHY